MYRTSFCLVESREPSSVITDENGTIDYSRELTIAEEMSLCFYCVSQTPKRKKRKGKIMIRSVRHLTCEMTTDKILTGSMHPVLSQWDHSGKKLSDVRGKPQSIYSILQTSTVSFTAGDSNFIDVYLNLGYVAFSLDAFPLE